MIDFIKPPGWGSRFKFPENQEMCLEDSLFSVTDHILVQMVDNYEDHVAAEIAAEARRNGASDVTVLNKTAILDALTKRTARRPDRRCYVGAVDVPVCPACLSGGISVRRSAFCPDCGQAIDWTEDGR